MDFKNFLKTLTPKRIALIVMCVMLLATVITVAVVAVKVGPLISALTAPPAATEPSGDPTTEPTTQPTTEPTTPPTTEPVTYPTEPGHVHEFTVLVEQVQPDCENPGYTIYKCECGKTQLADQTDALGHSYAAGKLVSPTCEEEGYTERKCTVCGQIAKEDVVEALGHDYVFLQEVEVSCEEDGGTEYQCSRCEDIKKEDVVKATGHDFEEVRRVEPACGTDGAIYYECSNCGEGKTEPIEAQNHSFGEWVLTVEPAPGRPGTETRTCSNCGGSETRQQKLALKEERAQDDNGTFYYTVTLNAADSKGKLQTVYTYEITDQGGFQNISFTFDPQTGLTVSFTAENVGRNYILPVGDGELVIDENGNSGAAGLVLGNQKGNLCYGLQVPTVTSTGLTGQTVNPASSGKVTMINFWATWCGYCVDEMPAMDRIAADYAGQVNVYAVHVGDSQSQTPQEFIAGSYAGSKIVFCLDSEEEYYSMLTDGKSVPVTLFLDANGVIREIWVGAPSGSTEQKYNFMKSVIDGLL